MGFSMKGKLHEVQEYLQSNHRFFTFYESAAIILNTWYNGIGTRKRDNLEV